MPKRLLYIQESKMRKHTGRKRTSKKEIANANNKETAKTLRIFLALFLHAL